jgi:F-type H+-transporting ATPase subunit b
MNMNLTMVGQAIAFGIFIWFSAKFVWPPLMRAIENRQKQIADGLAAGERGKQDLEIAEKRANEELDRAKKQAAEIIAQNEKRGSAIIEEAKAQATAEADRIKAGAVAELEQEVQRAKAQLRGQVAALAVAGAEKILKREVDQKAHADILGDLQAQL